MEHSELETAIHEMAEFAAMTGRTLENHKSVLQRHEEILAAQHRAGASHHEMIRRCAQKCRLSMHYSAFSLKESAKRIPCS